MAGFEKSFDDFMKQRRFEMREKYNRVLPCGELIFNRFDKAQYLGFGENSSVYDASIVMGNVTVGENVWIGPYTILDGSGGALTIGNFVSINAGVAIYTHDSTHFYISGGKAAFKKGEVVIQDNTVIGTLSIIGHGITIGRHCVIAANSFVNHDIPDFSIVAGTPAKIIGKTIINENGVEFKYSGGSHDTNELLEV